MNAADATPGWYHVLVLGVTGPRRQAAVMELTRPWPSSPLMPRVHAGWLNIWHRNPETGVWSLNAINESSVRSISIGDRLDKPPTDNA